MIWAAFSPIAVGVVLAVVAIVGIVLSLPRMLLGGPVQRVRGLLSIVVLVITMVAVFSAYFAFQRVAQEIRSPHGPNGGPTLSGPSPFLSTPVTFPSFGTPTPLPALGAP